MINPKITNELLLLADKCTSNSQIAPELYNKYEVKRGLRDLDGKGVLTGLTNISTIIASKNIGGKTVLCDGELYYRGININDFVDGFLRAVDGQGMIFGMGMFPGNNGI